MQCTYYKVSIACRSVSDIKPMEKSVVTCIIAAQHYFIIHNYVFYL